MTQATFTVRINVDNDSDLNPVHLCEEMQAYLNNNGNNKIKKKKDVLGRPYIRSYQEKLKILED